MSGENDPVDVALAELEVMRAVLETLKPLSPEERARVLAAVAARFGFYDIGIACLKDAEKLR